MRSHKFSPTTLLLLLSALLLISVTARADDNNADDEYEEHARVLRLSLVKGEVTVRRAGGDEWEQAQMNAPLVEGDTLATGRDARLEIQADSRNFIRVGENAVVRVVTLRDEGIALSLSEGTVTVRLAQFDHDKEYFEVDAPKSTVAAERTGLYRIDVDAQSVRVTVREDGRARIYSETSGFELRSDRTARLIYGGTEDEDWDLSAAASFDDWDGWNSERERDLASRLRYEGRERYYDPEVYGAEELDNYGDWEYTNDYGYVWSPGTTVVNNYNDWAPYRYGHWDWCNPYGWTWVADEPWGWAPYHYGRWVYYNNRWGWAPRGYGYNYRRARWRPALVAFVNLDFGGERRVCWYPLTYGQRDPRGRWWSRGFDPRSPQRAGSLPRSTPWLRAVSTVREHEFGTTKVRALPAGVEVAQRALTNEPVRNLPFTRGGGGRFEGRDGQGRERRADTPGGRVKGANGREVLVINRPAAITPAHALPDRQTGATRRTPGLPLDEELRRARVFNNRQPRVATPSSAGGALDNQSGGATGAVERPRRDRRPFPDAGGGASGDTTRERGDARGRGSEGGEATRSHPARSQPTAVSTPGETNNPGAPSTGGEPHRRRTDDRGDSNTNRYTPSRPAGERPTFERPNEERTREKQPASPPSYRPEPRERTSPPAERTSPPPERERPSRREEPPSYRPERKAPSESRPYEPPPRQEQPRPSTPRQEAPRQERPASPPARESGHPAKTERSESSSERKRP